MWGQQGNRGGEDKKHFNINKNSRMSTIEQYGTISSSKHNAFYTGNWKVRSLLVLQNFSTARKGGNISSYTVKLFSSDTRQSMKRRIATERLSKIYIGRY